MGGLTTLALISRCCREPKIAAALVLAGVSDPLAGPTLHDVTGPVLFAHDRWDIVVPFGQGKSAFAAARPPKYLLEVDYPLAGVASHLLPYFPGTPFATGWPRCSPTSSRGTCTTTNGHSGASAPTPVRKTSCTGTRCPVAALRVVTGEAGDTTSAPSATAGGHLNERLREELV